MVKKPNACIKATIFVADPDPCRELHVIGQPGNDERRGDVDAVIRRTAIGTMRKQKAAGKRLELLTTKMGEEGSQRLNRSRRHIHVITSSTRHGVYIMNGPTRRAVQPKRCTRCVPTSKIRRSEVLVGKITPETYETVWTHL